MRVFQQQVLGREKPDFAASSVNDTDAVDYKDAVDRAQKALDVGESDILIRSEVR
jgi:hypothetical protein